VDGIELDIHATSDGIPVVIHDTSLSRTLGKEAHVTELPFEHLRSIAPTVPSFAEVLDLIGSALHFDIEVKQAGIERQILDLLATYPDSRWSISCFDWGVLEQFRELHDDCDLWLLSPLFTTELVENARRLRASAAALYDPSITEETAQEAHSAGLTVMAWTVNDVSRARELEAWGIEMLCTDAPHLFVS
jgi:glycerophosphoryl diester phosphodiesterase